MKKFLVAVTLLMLFVNVGFLIYKNKQVEPQTPPVAQNQPVNPITPLPHTPDKPEPQKPQPEVIPIFVEVPEFRKSEEGSVYGDILSHSQEAPFGDAHGRATNAHETGHGIHSYLRNKYTREMGKKVNGFYCLGGRGCVIEEPKIRKSDANKFVPENLRSYRWSTYMTGQMAWDDTPLYIYDEWVAYVLGGKTNVDDVQHGRYKGGWTDGVSGCLGFSIYATAICMAVKEKDPAYWESNTQFKNFTIWMLKEAHRTYMMGHTMDQFKWEKQDQLLNNLLTASEGEPIRRFMRDHLEGDKHWLGTDTKILKAIYYEPHQTRDLPPPNPKCFRCLDPNCKHHEVTPSPLAETPQLP